MIQQRLDGEAIYALLLRDIQAGRIPEGGYLKEVDLASRFGVSRTPVRDVLNRMVLERLLVRTSKGLRPRRVTPEEIIQVYDLRILLESEAAAQAAKNRHVTDVVALRGLLERDRALVHPEDAIRTSTNIEFHEVIWQAAHNAVLLDVLERLSLHAIHKPSSTLSIGGRWSDALDEHERILQAIDRQNAEEAAAVMAEHMRTARDLRLSLFGQVIER
ncbi:GntR family transcriptional regulator [Leucobacter celer]|uniref:GntR family transcriptional regulator n=1 Tax=Leucobacter celer TaxID=668625 RepID=UPI000A65A5A6|nr:GntR family transcriptional regulator [Leucobacter celer]